MTHLGERKSGERERKEGEREKEEKKKIRGFLYSPCLREKNYSPGGVCLSLLIFLQISASFHLESQGKRFLGYR